MNHGTLATPSLRDCDIIFGDKELHRIIDLWKFPKSGYGFWKDSWFFAAQCVTKVHTYTATPTGDDGVGRPSIDVQQLRRWHTDLDPAIGASPPALGTVPTPNEKRGKQQNQREERLHDNRQKTPQSVQHRDRLLLCPTR